MKFRILFLLALGMLFFACQKSENEGPSDNTPGQPTEGWESDGTNIQTGGAYIAPQPTGTPPPANFAQTALEDFKERKGDGLVGGGDSELQRFLDNNPSLLVERDATAVNFRGNVNGFGFQDAKTFPLAKARDVAVITSDSTGDSFTSFMAMAITWQSENSGRIYISIVKDTLVLGTMEALAYPEENTTPDILWLGELDAFTNQPVPDGRLGYVFVNRTPAVGFKNELGYDRRVEAIYYSSGSPEYYLWQMPQLEVTHVFSLLFEWAGAGDARASQDLSNLPCVAVNESGLLSSKSQPNNRILITATAPIAGVQAVMLSPTAVNGWTQAPSFLIVGTESWQLPPVWGPANLNQFVLSFGTIWDNGVPSEEDGTCFEQ